GLENYDALGIWRAQDNGATIDASGVLPGGKAFNGPNELKRILKGQSDQFCRAVASKMLTYALGRGLERFDKCALEEISSNARLAGYKFSALVNEIVRSDPFQKRSGKLSVDTVAHK